MKPLPVGIAVAILIALLWWFWPRERPASTTGVDTAKALVASTPAPAPAAPAPAATSEPAVAAGPTPAPVAPPPPPPPLTATVYFDFDRSAIHADDLPKLDAFAASLKDRNYTSVSVVGFADRIGEAPHNDALSRKRADATVAYLTSKGVDAARSKSEGKGESDAVTGVACKDLGAENATNKRLVDCLQKDRRVEVAVVN